ncbi:MAG: hypothetical protein IPF54_09075 [Draconibacterium sp.]|nr:hypothetical protein [Draconibacterium sp.]
MKKVFLFLAAVLVVVTVSAQVDLSGSWKLNSSKSKLGEQFSMAPKEIIIAQKGNDLSVERHAEWQGEAYTTNDKFTLDGKECKSRDDGHTKKIDCSLGSRQKVVKNNFKNSDAGWWRSFHYRSLQNGWWKYGD